jgi:hypothetical protein
MPRSQLSERLDNAQKIIANLGQLALALLPAIGEQISDLSAQAGSRVEISRRAEANDLYKQCSRNILDASPALPSQHL